MKIRLLTIAMAVSTVFSVNCGTAEKPETKNAASTPAVATPAATANTNTMKPADADDVKNVNKPVKMDNDDVKKSTPTANSSNKRSDRDTDDQNKNIRREDREKRERNDDDDK